MSDTSPTHSILEGSLKKDVLEMPTLDSFQANYKKIFDTDIKFWEDQQKKNNDHNISR